MIYDFSLIYQRHLSELIMVGEITFIFFAGDTSGDTSSDYKSGKVNCFVQKKGHYAQFVLLLSAHWVGPLLT